MNNNKKLHDGVSDLSGKAFTPSHVRNNPLTYLVRVMREDKVQPAGSPHKNSLVALEKFLQKEDLLIRDL